jgi:hypothetical protein
MALFAWNHLPGADEKHHVDSAQMVMGKRF